MILPTCEQMYHLAPAYAWQEPDYKSVRWKYDPPIEIPWQSFTMQRKSIKSHNLTDGVSITDISQHTFVAHVQNELEQLIDALYEIGVVIYIARYSRVTLSLAEIVDNCTIKKIIIIVESGAQVTCIDERNTSTQPVHSSAIEVHVDKNAQFNYIDRQTLPQHVSELRSLKIFVDADSTVTMRSWWQGAHYAKTWTQVYLQGPNADVRMEFGGLLHSSQYYSLITEQHHRAPYTQSHCAIKYAQYEMARTMYDGCIIIEKEGIKSQAFQQHHALLVHAGARAYAHPTLEAKTNDVQCGHGSAIGMLDDEQLWYLQSRGIDRHKAQNMLIDAFLKGFFI